MSIHTNLYPLLAGLLIILTLAACVPATPATQPPAAPTPDPNQPVSSTPGSSDPVPAQPANPYAPQPGDEKLPRGEVFIDSMDLLVMESYPPQFRLALAGNLPTPCHQLRIQLNDPDAAGKIEVEVYSLTDPDRMCTQVLQPFDAALPLQYPAGKYTLWVNGQQVGTMDVPG